VSRGENAGRKLGHTAVVRRLVTLGSVKLAEGKVFTTEQGMNKEWKKDKLRAVVLIQERSSRHILGAAALAIGDSQRNQD
jgi:hypothetical protein